MAVCLIAGAGVGALVSVLTPKQYTATASVLVVATETDNTSVAGSRTTNQINLDTEAQLVKSGDVVSAAQKRSPLVPSGPTGQVVKHLHIEVPANTSVLNIAFTARTAAAAQASANAFASAYLDDRRANAQALLNQEIDAAQAKVSSLTTQLKQVSQDEQGLSKSSRQYLYDQDQRNLLTNQISTLNQTLITLQGTQITPGRVLNSAARPHHPSSPNRKLDLASGLGLGLILGLLLAWVRVTHRSVVRDVSDLEHSIDVPALAEVDDDGSGLLAAPGSADSEAFRRLSILAMAAIKQPGTVVLSTTDSAQPDFGIAANLAAAIAASGASVGVLRITDVPAEDAQLSPAVRVLSVERAETVRQRFGGSSTREALERARGDNDVLLVDAPCPTRTADAQTLAVLSDAVVMAVSTGTRMKVVQEAVEQFDAVAAPMLGVVLVRVHPVSSGGRKRADGTAAKTDRVRLYSTALANVAPSAAATQRSTRRPLPAPREQPPAEQAAALEPTDAEPTDAEPTDAEPTDGAAPALDQTDRAGADDTGVPAEEAVRPGEAFPAAGPEPARENGRARRAEHDAPAEGASAQAIDEPADAGPEDDQPRGAEPTELAEQTPPGEQTALKR